MREEIIDIDCNLPVDKWHEIISEYKSGDYIFLCDNEDLAIWFSTNYMQYLSRMGGNEVAPIYGNLVHNLEEFCYQVNLSLPFGFRIRADFHALYDILLNFETEPTGRFLFWNNAEYLLNMQPELFAEIFSELAVAAYLNRNAISTIKENGARYQVNQTNILLFQNTSIEKLSHILNRDYYIPSIDIETRGDFNLKFQIFRIVSSDDITDVE